MWTKKDKTSLILNILIIIIEIAGFIACFYFAGSGWYGVFVYYTQCSNLFALIVSIIFVVTLIKCKKNNVDIPQWLRNIRFLATSCLSVTFVIVVIILAPISAFQYGPIGYIALFVWKDMWAFHFIAPVLSIISTVFMEGDTGLDSKQMFIGTIPTIAYAIISTTANVLKLIVGPYPFLHVYEQPWWASVLWFIAIPSVAYIITRIMWKINKKVFKAN